MEKWYNLKEIFDLESWEDLQDALSDVTKMAILMVNYKGEPITKHSGCHAFCHVVRNDPKMKKYCQKCDARAGFEAMQDNAPFIYKCYFSIVDIAIPIIVNKKYVGAIMAGQIRISEDGDHLEQILHIADNAAQKEIEAKRAELSKEYEDLPYLSYGRIRVIANLLYYLCNYMSHETAKKEEILAMYETVLEGRMESDEWKKEIGSQGIRLTEPKERDLVAEEMKNYLPDDGSEVVQNAFRFILSDRSKMYSLKEVAEHCHVSTGYLSRLFSKEIGKSYSKFLPELKVDWAKEMLISEDATISEVAERLGFNETGYFIKIFKKQTGVTPLVYKKYHKMK